MTGALLVLCGPLCPFAHPSHGLYTWIQFIILLPKHNWIWLQRIFIYKAKQLTHGWLRLISKEHCATTYFAQCQPTTHACMSEEFKLIHDPKTRLVEGCIWANMHFHFLTLGFYNCEVCVLQPTPMKRTTPCPSLQSKHLCSGCSSKYISHTFWLFWSGFLYPSTWLIDRAGKGMGHIMMKLHNGLYHRRMQASHIICAKGGY